MWKTAFNQTVSHVLNKSDFSQSKAEGNSLSEEALVIRSHVGDNEQMFDQMRQKSVSGRKLIDLHQSGEIAHSEIWWQHHAVA